MKRLGRWVLILLALELVLAFWLGDRIRARFEAPVRIIGAVRLAPAGPLHVGQVGAPVLDAGHHEQEIG